MLSVFDIRKQFTFYGAYHTNAVNVAIHIVCVPLIIWFALHPLNYAIVIISHYKQVPPGLCHRLVVALVPACHLP